MYPGDGLFEADYPLVLSRAAAADDGLSSVARSLLERVRSTEFATTLVDQGVRPARNAAGGAAAAAPTGDGLMLQYAAPAAIPAETEAVAQRASQWSQYKRLAYQVLLLVDGSASMNDQVRDRSGMVFLAAHAR